ncbi:MAG TPA: hypothetical protein VK879_22925 [Candidatus Sulfomarinibacteraceae bacterium]|nr:hypothetical protein [Candidatus Sulfomarinibacteraceae bacterium]
MTATSLTILRPLRAGEILDRAIRLYRQHFLTFVGIIALVQVPLILVQMLSSLLAFGGFIGGLEEILANPAAAPDSPMDIFGPSYLAGASLSSLTGILGFILVQGVATAALTYAVASAYLGSETAETGGIIGAYRHIKDVWIPMVAALLLAIALTIVCAIWWLVPCVGWLTGGGMLLFLWLVIIPLLAPVIVLERQSPTTAWRRAWTLARRRFWWVLGFALLLYLFNLLVVAGPAAVIASIGQFTVSDPFDFSQGTFTIQTIVQSLTTLVTSLLYLPLQVAAMTVLYFDLRVRSEGLDLALAARASDHSQDRVAQVGTVASATERRSLFTGIEWRNFLLVTLLAVGFFVVIYAALIGLVLAVAAAFSAGF